MKIVSSTLRRAAGPALVAGLVVIPLATPAAAQTPGSTAVRSGGTVVLNARTGAENHVTADSSSGGHLILTDTSGITAGPGCTQSSAQTADCGTLSTVSSLVISLGDQDDSLLVKVKVNTTVNAGSGKDTVATGGGNDTISVSDGVPGNDTVTCDGGADVAFGDPLDHLAADCETRFPF